MECIEALMILFCLVDAASAGCSSSTARHSSACRARPIPAGSCGQAAFDMRRNPNRRQRIAGGRSAVPFSHPWLVTLEKKVSASTHQRYDQAESVFEHGCGAAIVQDATGGEHTKLVITAAHCIDQGSPELFGDFKRYRLNNIRIRSGVHDRRQHGDQSILANYAFVPSQYNPPSKHHDIAIIKLRDRLHFSNRTQPVCLPPPGDLGPAVDSEGTVAGWGTSRESLHYSNFLMQVGVPIVDDSECEQTYRNTLNPFDAAVSLCAGYTNGRMDACQGDSGGPLVLKDPNRGYVMYGIVSYDISCANGVSVYTRVTSFTVWINDMINWISSS